MNNTTEIAHDLGLLTIPNGMLLRPQDIMQTAPSKLVAVVSGTQGEPMSALVPRGRRQSQSLSLCNPATP